MTADRSEYMRAYRKEHREQRNEYNRDWGKANPQKVLASREKHREKKCESARSNWQKQMARPGFREHRRLENSRRLRRHGEVLARIKDVPCVDCGGRFHHSQMEFDHRPGTTKELSIGRMKKAPIQRLLAEIEKCDIVCANCHALRTWQRAQMKPVAHPKREHPQRELFNGSEEPKSDTK
jgi:hypothetical protein